MARIMKVRTVPRGYVERSDLKGFVHEHNGKTPAEWFMALYGKFGNPQEGGLWSYLLRHNNVLLKVTAIDNSTMDYDVWVSPGVMQNAIRRRIKVVNVIARRLNENDVVFLPSDGDELYYAIRKKNEELQERQPERTAEETFSIMKDAMTDEERKAVYGSVSQYMDGAKEEIVMTMAEIFNEEGKYGK